MWAEIPRLPGFHGSEDGQIKNRHGRILSQWQRKAGGAFRVRIKGRDRMVSFLILTAFTGRPPCDGFYVRYRNKNRADSHKDNLMWAGRPSTTNHT